MTSCAARAARGPLPQADPTYQPLVSLHIPAYNEPPELLIETIKAVEQIDYPELRDRRHRQQHAGSRDLRPGRGVLPRSRADQVRPRGTLAGLQGRRVQPGPAALHRPARRDHRHGRRRRHRQAVLPPRDRSVLLRPSGSASCRPSKATGTSREATTTRPASTRTRASTWRSCRHGTSATPCRSSARWVSSAAVRSRKSAAGTSGASARTPRPRCGCSRRAGRACTSRAASAGASCRRASPG